MGETRRKVCWKHPDIMVEFWEAETCPLCAALKRIIELAELMEKKTQLLRIILDEPPVVEAES